MQPTHMRRKSGVKKTWRLFHVDLFDKNIIEEGIMNIKLMNLLIMWDRNGED
jgi:aryl carrier-like protein